MEASLGLGFILTFSFLIGQSWQENSFENFRTCVLERGIPPTRIVVRGYTRAYNDLNFHWQLRPPNIRPSAYVVAYEESDVVSAVVCGKQYYVRVVPRSGGHSFEKYSFGDNCSVVVDLRRLHDVVLENSKSTALIGSGALVGPIIMTLWNEAKSFFPVSSCPTVGISGLASGGGYGYAARSHGLTTDYIVGVRMVTADGQIIVADNETNSDLYWALRGGGAASFGIVTSFTMKVVPAPPTFFTATPTWPLESFPNVYEAWQNFTLNGPRSLTAKMNIGGGSISILFADSTGTESNYDEVQSLFPPTNSTIRKSYDFPDFLLGFAGTLTIPGVSVVNPESLLRLQRDSVSPTYQIERSFYVERMATPADLKILRDLLLEMPDSVNAAFQAYGGAINDIGIDQSAFIHREDRFALGIIAMYGATNTTAVPEAQLFLNKYFEIGAKLLNGKESYQNYVDGQLRDYLPRYYGSNLPRLIEIKKNYDPDNYFNNPQSIPTEIPRDQKSNRKGQRST